jgi:hypothetical protein
MQIVYSHKVIAYTYYGQVAMIISIIRECWGAMGVNVGAQQWNTKNSENFWTTF